MWSVVYSPEADRGLGLLLIYNKVWSVVYSPEADRGLGLLLYIIRCGALFIRPKPTVEKAYS